VARETAGPDPLVRVWSAFSFWGRGGGEWGGDFRPGNHDFLHIKLIFVRIFFPKFARFLPQVPEGSQKIKNNLLSHLVYSPNLAKSSSWTKSQMFLKKTTLGRLWYLSTFRFWPSNYTAVSATFTATFWGHLLKWSQPYLVGT